MKQSLGAPTDVPLPGMTRDELETAPKVFHFSVAARLFRELGEKLVGRPGTALAELVKNAYDADAFHVEISLDPPKLEKGFGGRIVVRDSGHGMTEEEFESFWMRVGSGHKADEEVSPYLGRPLTGSKGIGRIAVQFLSDKVRIETISTMKPETKLVADLDWKEALRKADLIDVPVRYRNVPTPRGEFPGTSIILDGLKQTWTEQEVVELSQEIWTLEPPFRKKDPPMHLSWGSIPPLPPRDGTEPSSEGRKVVYRTAGDFSIVFNSPYREIAQQFEKRRRQVLELWEARIRGKIEDGHPKVSVEFHGEKPIMGNFSFLNGSDASLLKDVEFDILIYDPKGRQQGGIPVSEVREYLRSHGGVQIFDSGFRLPFYGRQDNDWLRITDDHARRLSTSELLPKDLQVPEGMYYMPTYYQVFGFVNVSTSAEDNLDISITRDRLLESKAYFQMRDVIRATIHWYGSLRTIRLRRDLSRQPVEPLRVTGTFTDVLRSYKAKIPEPVFRALDLANQRTTQQVQRSAASMVEQVAALSGYATAGVAAIAYQHEIMHQLEELERIANDIEKLNPKEGSELAARLRQRILDWTARARELRNVFSPLLERENTQEMRRFDASAVVSDVIRQLSSSLGGVQVDNQVLAGLRLPPATYVEWTSVLQNVVFNAINAMRDRRGPHLRFTSEIDGRMRRVVLEDSGVGLDLRRQEEYFRPFYRGLQLDPQYVRLGYGGTGLGLTIVRMIATRRQCRTFFREPSKGYSTAFVMEWNEVMES